MSVLGAGFFGPTADGYEAPRLQVTERHLFDRSWQAVQFAGDFKAES